MFSTKDLLIVCLIIVFTNVLVIESSKVILRPNTTSASTVSTDNSCSISSFDLCLSKIQEVMQDSNLALATNREDLNLACRKLKEGDTCADNHIKNCTNKSQKMLYQEIVRGTKQVIMFLCKTGDFQNNYLRYSHCFKNVSMSEQKCAPILRKVQTMSANLSDKTSDAEEGLKNFCCAFKDSFYCQINYVRRDCGERAVKFFEKYLTEISFSLMQQHCNAYTYSNNCDPKVDSLNHSSNIKHLNGFHFLINISVLILMFSEFLDNIC